MAAMPHREIAAPPSAGAAMSRRGPQPRVLPRARPGTRIAFCTREPMRPSVSPPQHTLDRPPPSHGRRGQASVELALMVPLLFAVLFCIVELAFFFGDTHYVNYAAFSAARAQQVGGDAERAASMLLDGNATSSARVSADAGGSVKVSQDWPMSLPFTESFGDLDFDVTVVAGPDEEQYEGRSGRLPQLYADNNCRGGC